MKRIAMAPRQAGFTYIGALIAVVVTSIFALASLDAGSAIQQRAAEEDLLAIGDEFRNAFISFAQATPPGRARTPMSLEELLKDPRFPDVRRHLRRIYADPLVKGASWGLVPAPNGQGIAGIYSTAGGIPFKTGNFSLVHGDFDHAASYAQWKFMPPLEMLESAASPAKPLMKVKP